MVPNVFEPLKFDCNFRMTKEDVKLKKHFFDLFRDKRVFFLPKNITLEFHKTLYLSLDIQVKEKETR